MKKNIGRDFNTPITKIFEKSRQAVGTLSPSEAAAEERIKAPSSGKSTVTTQGLDLKPDGTPYKTSAKDRKYQSMYHKRRAILGEPMKESDSPDLDIVDMPVNRIPDPASLPDAVWAAEQKASDWHDTQKALNDAKLTDREKTVLRLRFGFAAEYPQTLEAIGHVIHLSPERARQIEQKALRKIRRAMPRAQRAYALVRLKEEDISRPLSFPPLPEEWPVTPRHSRPAEFNAGLVYAFSLMKIDVVATLVDTYGLTGAEPVVPPSPPAARHAHEQKQAWALETLENILKQKPRVGKKPYPKNYPYYEWSTEDLSHRLRDMGESLRGKEGRQRHMLRAVAALPPLNRDIIEMYYGLNGKNPDYLQREDTLRRKHGYPLDIMSKFDDIRVESIDMLWTTNAFPCSARWMASNYLTALGKRTDPTTFQLARSLAERLERDSRQKMTQPLQQDYTPSL